MSATAKQKIEERQHQVRLHNAYLSDGLSTQHVDWNEFWAQKPLPMNPTPSKVFRTDPRLAPMMKRQMNLFAKIMAETPECPYCHAKHPAQYCTTVRELLRDLRNARKEKKKQVAELKRQAKEPNRYEFKDDRYN